MPVKSERITILGSRDFKSFLNEEAKRERISVSELVRRRCEQRPQNEGDEELFAELVAELRTSVSTAKKSLNKGISDAESVLKELRSRAPATVNRTKVTAR